METLVIEDIAQRTRINWVGWTFILQEVSQVTLLEVDRGCSYLTFLIDKLRPTLLVQAHEWDRENGTHRITLLSKTATTNHIHHRSLIEEGSNLSLVVRIYETCIPREILRLDIGRRNTQLLTPRLHLT